MAVFIITHLFFSPFLFYEEQGQRRKEKSEGERNRFIRSDEPEQSSDNVLTGGFRSPLHPQRFARQPS